jgi:hypothetical protein
LFLYTDFWPTLRFIASSPVGGLPGAVSLELGRPWPDSDHSPPCSVHITNSWSFTPLLPYIFKACCLLTETTSPSPVLRRNRYLVRTWIWTRTQIKICLRITLIIVLFSLFITCTLTLPLVIPVVFFWDMCVRGNTTNWENFAPNFGAYSNDNEALPEATLTCAWVRRLFAKLGKMHIEKLFKGKSHCVWMLPRLQLWRDIWKLASRRVFQSDGIRWKALRRITQHVSVVVTRLMWWLYYSRIPFDIYYFKINQVARSAFTIWVTCVNWDLPDLGSRHSVVDVLVLLRRYTS